MHLHLLSDIFTYHIIDITDAVATLPDKNIAQRNKEIPCQRNIANPEEILVMRAGGGWNGRTMTVLEQE